MHFPLYDERPPLGQLIPPSYLPVEHHHGEDPAVLLVGLAFVSKENRDLPPTLVVGYRLSGKGARGPALRDPLSP